MQSRILALAGITVLAAGCGPTSISNQVANGAARLTVRNVGAVTSLLNANTTCGFASMAVLQAATVDGTVGGPGSVTLTVSNCTIDAGSGGTPTGAADCNGNVTTAFGKVTVTSATRTVRGTLTGNVMSPVVPENQDATTIQLNGVTFEDFRADSSASDNKITFKNGGLTATVKPRLAVAADSGACAIATPNTGFEGISFTAETEFQIEGSSNVTGTIYASRLTAQNGVGSNGKENFLEGQMELASRVGIGSSPPILPNKQEVHEVPGTDTDGLDPDYDAAKFASNYQCATVNPNLLLPQSFTCADLTPRLADGASRLTIKTLGTVVGMLDKDTMCGFSSNNVKAAAVLNGSVGEEGSLTLTVSGCTINLPNATELTADCGGVKTTVRGQVRVNATKIVTGRLTGDATTPVIPMTDSPATFSVQATFTDFRVGSTADASALTARSGTLSGTVQPRVALASDSGACSIASPIARFSTVTWGNNSDLAVSTSSGTFNLPVNAAALSAVNGTWGADSNTLSGTMTVGTNAALTIPSDGMGLNPTFTQAAFDASWQCATVNPTLVTPVSHSCEFESPLAAGVARLTPRMFAAVVSALNSNTSCGFSASGANAPAVALSAAPGNSGTVTQTIAQGTPCVLSFSPEQLLGTADCAGSETRVFGQVAVYGTKVVSGRITGDPTTPVVPTSRTPAVFNLTASFTNFRVRSTTSTSELTGVSGTLSGRLTPVTGMDTTTGACSISTPVATFEDLTWTNGVVRLVSSGRNFNLAVATSNLDAQNGSKDGVTNRITGSLTLDGTAYTLPVPGDDTDLDPDFNQTNFDAAYACTPNLMVAGSDAVCTFEGVMAQGVSRLTPRTYGIVTSIVNGNTSCGFSSPGVVGAALATGTTGTVGRPGGSMVFTIPQGSPCELTFTTPYTLPTPDCAGVTTTVEGIARVTGTKTIAQGWLTGDPTNPIVPSSRDAVTFALSMELVGFKVTTSTSANALTATTGTLTGSMSPRLAIDGVTGACSVSTPVVTFTDLAWNNAALVLQSGARTFNVTASTSNLDAQAGDKDAVTNTITGSINLNGTNVTVPVNPADPRLDPDFVQATFDTSYACIPNLVKPTSDAQCSFYGALGQGVSRLTPKTFGTVVSLADAATTACGFKSPAVGGTPVITGASVGDDGATAVFTVASATPCEVTFAAPTVVATDCNGVTTSVEGTVSFHGTKTVRGLRTGDAADPIIPTSRDPATFALTATFTNFRVTSSNSTRSMTALDGTATFQVDPRVALDPTTGACSKSTPVVSFSNMAWTNANVRVHNGNAQFNLAVATSDLDAQNGNKDAVVNTLGGTITVDTIPLTIPVAGDTRLDPDFVQATFDSTYQCAAANLIVPPVEAACNFKAALGTNAARLLVKNLANAFQLWDGSNTCGFKAPAVLGAGVPNTTPVVGQPITITFTSNACEPAIPGVDVPNACMLPVSSRFAGTFSASGTKAVSGVHQGMANPVVPVSPTAAVFDVTAMTFTNFTAHDVIGGAPQSRMTFSGDVTADVNPVGASGPSAGVFGISSPVAGFSNFTVANGTAVMVSPNPATAGATSKTFNVTITQANLAGFIGSHMGVSNDLTGTITVNGQQTTLAADTALDTAFNQTTFDASYVCTPGLLAVVPAN